MGEKVKRTEIKEQKKIEEKLKQRGEKRLLYGWVNGWTLIKKHPEVWTGQAG